ncbi:hypothetical protein CJ179_38300 [Rhodococcus sp. ACS1]|uniref:hypothetical protein n=1 Tax=Rhodococcus sp. ACS1 TaxID=2028570 RepID=UPI000BB1322B|nr:hypothetical protein [Rhodococcus sp. ACS1]PBC38460.1 hypothetical protein CJ179_38300 [Rhodococcus sp. ACS1]
MAFQPTVAQRAYLYKIVLTLIPVLVILGVALPGDIDVYFALAAAVLGVPATGVALSNVSEGPKDL